MPSDPPSTKSKGSFWSQLRRPSDKTKTLPKSPSGSGSRQLPSVSTHSDNSLSPVPQSGSRPQNNSDIYLPPTSHALKQQSSTSAPDLGSSGSSGSIPGIVETVVDRAARIFKTTKHNTAVTTNTPGNSWGGLEAALKALHQSAQIFPPLQSAIGTLISCLELVQGAPKNLREYDELASGLGGLATQLEKHLREYGTTGISDSVANIIQSIGTEVEQIKGKKNRGMARGIIEATRDEDELIQCYRRVEGHFHRLQINISLSAWSIANEHLANTRLESLTPAKLASYNSALCADINRRTCTKDTRTVVLSEMNSWSQDPAAANVYWMNGMAGTGKTTIACSLSKALEERKQLGASFFCTRTSPECRSAKRIVPTIAYQLARYCHPFQAALCRALEKDPDIGMRQVALQFERLILKPLEEVEATMPKDVVVVIDALDECEDAQVVRVILETLFKHVTKIPLKFFVTSRPEPEIWDEMKSLDNGARSILHLHEIEQTLVQEDIELYLMEELKFMSPSEKQVKQLAPLAGCLFIYAATAVRYIRPSNSRGGVDPRERLEVVLAINSQSTKQHSELDSLYRTILCAALNEERLECKEMERMRLVLWTSVCAREPVPVETLAALAGSRSMDVQVALQSLRSVLHVSEASGLVSTLHASFPEFMFTQARAQQFFCDKSHASLMAQRCFEVMTTELRFNVCKLRCSFDMDDAITDLEGRISKYISRPLFYACRYWADHLLSTAPAGNLVFMLEEFLSKQLLFWTEVLNLNKVITHGASMLRKIQPWLLDYNASSDRSLLQLISDAETFATIFGANPISLSTPHIYFSALPIFCKSVLGLTSYWKRMQGIIDLEGTGIEQMKSTALASWSTGDRVQSVALSHDGRLVVFGGGELSIRLRRGSQRLGGSSHCGILNRHSGHFVVGPFRRGAELITSVAFSPDGRCVVSGSEDKTICVLDAQDGKLVAGPFKGHDADVRSVAFSPDGTRIVSSSDDMTICVWTAFDGKLVAGPFKRHIRRVNCAVFSPDGTRIVSGSDDMTICIWNAHEGELLTGPLQEHAGSVTSVVFSPDGRRIASGSADKTICMWDSTDGKLVAGPFEGHTDRVNSVAFSPDSGRIVSGSDDRTICVWEANDGNLVAGPFKGHTQSVTSVAFTPDGTHIVSGSNDTTICVWNAQYSNATNMFKGHTQPVNSAAFCPHGTLIVSGSDDKTICVWSAQDGRLVVGPFNGHTSKVMSVSFSPDGTHIVSGSADKTICVWNTQDGKRVAGRFKGHSDTVRSVAFSPDGTRIVSGSDDKTICVWNAQDGKRVAGPCKRHTHWVTSVAFSPDGTRIVSGSGDRTICVWNAQDGNLVAGPFKGHTHWVRSVAFSPDGTCIVSGSADKTICVWNVQDGSLVAGPFKGHTHWVMSVAFSPDGTRIVSGSGDKTICVWNIQDGKLVAGPFKGHSESVSSVAYSPNGTRILSCSRDCSIRVINLQAISSPIPALDGDWDLKSSGWVVNSAGEHLFWVPQHLHPSLPRPYESLAIGPQGSLQIDYSNILIGERWSECYVGE